MVPLQTYCLHILEEAVQNEVNNYLLFWLSQSVRQTAALERTAKRRELRMANWDTLYIIRVKNQINPQQSLIAQSMNMLMVIDPEKKIWKILIKTIFIMDTKLQLRNSECRPKTLHICILES